MKKDITHHQKKSERGKEDRQNEKGDTYTSLAVGFFAVHLLLLRDECRQIFRRTCSF